MKQSKRINKRRWRRRNRVRNQLKSGPPRPRLTVFRSAKHLYCQVIDDQQGLTLASASTLDKQLREGIKNGGNRQAAKTVGQAIAQRAQAAGVKTVCFDRGVYRFHGRVAELANAAREAGLEF